MITDINSAFANMGVKLNHLHFDGLPVDEEILEMLRDYWNIEERKKNIIVQAKAKAQNIRAQGRENLEKRKFLVRQLLENLKNIEQETSIEEATTLILQEIDRNIMALTFDQDIPRESIAKIEVMRAKLDN